MFTKCTLPRFWGLFLFCSICIFFGAACSSQENLSPEQKQYYSAVHVFQSFFPELSTRPVNIPPKIMQSDSTVSLLAHSDKRFVLSEIARTFDGLDPRTYPDAPLFAAYSYFALDSFAESAKLLKEYVTRGAYDPLAYLYLCKSLKKLADYTALYLVCLEWQEKDSSCSKERSDFIWEVLVHMEQYKEAELFALEQKACLGVQSFLLAARAALLQGNSELAEEYIEIGSKDFCTEEVTLKRTWALFFPL